MVFTDYPTHLNLIINVHGYSEKQILNFNSNFMRKHFFPSTIICVISFLLIFSCKKETAVDSSLINEAKTWFTTVLLAKENNLLAKPISALPKGSYERVLARMNRLANKLDWNNVKLSSKNGTQVIAIPLVNDKINTINNSTITRVFVFYKRQREPMHLEIVELINKKGEVSNCLSVAFAAFNNRLFKQNNPIEIQDISIFFYDENYIPIVSYEINNTNWIVLNAYCTNRKKISTKHNERSSLNADCEEWGTFLVEYDDYGNIVSEVLLFTYLVCQDGDGIDTGESSDPSGSGGNGGGDPNNDDEVNYTRSANFEWEFWHLTSAQGGGSIRVVHYVVGRFYPNRPQNNKFIGGYFSGEVLRFFLGTTDFIVENSNVAIDSQTQATAHMTGKFKFDDNTTLRVNNSKSKNFSEIPWPL
jgi:hypothetical protein